MPDQSGLDALSMLLLGLLGTGHCLGMCGPLVIALPGQFGRWQAHLAYHTGRVSTYTLAGACLGWLGQGWYELARRPDHPALGWLIHTQMAAAVLAALFLLLFGLNRLSLLPEPDWLTKANPGKIPGFAWLMRRTIKDKRLSAVFLTGLLLGLLPCGLSYAAFARALAAGGPWAGGWLSLLFGLGTLPGLMALGTGAGALFRRYRVQAEMIAGLIMIGMAAMIGAKVWAAFL